MGCHETLGIDIWVQKGRRKVGKSGNILVKLNIPISKFDVFDIREDYCPNIQNMEKIHLLGFPIKRFWEKYLEISRSVFFGPLFLKYDWMGAHDSRLKSLVHFGLIHIFLAVIYLFVTAYLSKSFNLSEKSSKMIKIQYTDPKPVF